MIIRIDGSSREQIRVNVEAIGIDTAVLTSYPVEFAFPVTGSKAEDADWQTAHWVAVDDQIASVQIGPGSETTLTLSVGFYDVYVRVHESGPSGDIPILYAGVLKIV